MDILDGVLGATPEAVATPEPQAQIEPATGPVRGPDGKFASAQAEEPQPEPTPAPVAEPEPVAPIPPPASEPVKAEPGHVPIAALMDERDKRKAAEARAQEIEQRLQQQQQPPTPYQPPPSVFEDEAGYANYVQSQIAEASLNTRLDLSEEMARTRHGEELVDAAKAWALQRFAQSPAFYQEVISQRNPYEYAVQAHKRDQALAQLQDPSELESFMAWKAAGGSTAPAPAPVLTAPAVVIPQAPSPSLASASSAGGPATVPTGPGQAFDQTFK